MKSSILAIGAMIGLFVLSSGMAHAESRAAEAIDQLDKAKTSKHPIEHLERARHELEESDRVKRGEKWEALEQVRAAIESVRRGEDRAVLVHIERAIHEIKEGKK